MGLDEGFHGFPGNGEIAADDNGLAFQGIRQFALPAFRGELQAGCLQTADFLQVVLLLEVGQHAVCNDIAYIRDRE